MAAPRSGPACRRPRSPASAWPRSWACQPEEVTVNVTLLGGGFGRKSKPDFVVEAAVLAQAMGGAPVKVVWTREDDLHHSFFHTVSVERLEAGLDADGQPRGLAAPQRRAHDRLDLRARSRARSCPSSWAWA